MLPTHMEQSSLVVVHARNGVDSGPNCALCDEEQRGVQRGEQESKEESIAEAKDTAYKDLYDTLDYI